MNLEDSPLKEAEKGSLAELFQRDPLSLTNDDVEAICKELRARRQAWALDESKGKEKKEKVTLSKGEMDDLLNSLI